MTLLFGRVISETDYTSTGPYGHDQRNETGTSLIQFAFGLILVFVIVSSIRKYNGDEHGHNLMGSLKIT